DPPRSLPLRASIHASREEGLRKPTTPTNAIDDRVRRPWRRRVWNQLPPEPRAAAPSESALAGADARRLPTRESRSAALCGDRTARPRKIDPWLGLRSRARILP